MEEIRGSIKKLPILEILSESIRAIWKIRYELTKKVSLPVLLLIFLKYAKSEIGDLTEVMEYIFLLPYFIIYTYFAIICHRLLIFGDESSSFLITYKWTIRESIFLGWMVSFFVIVLIIAAVIFGTFGYLNYLKEDNIISGY